MIDESLLKSNFLGKDGFIWWIGQVADPSVWRNENTRIDGDKEESGKDPSNEPWAYRCKVRIIGYHSFSRNELPDDDLPWAHVLTSASDGAPGQGGFGKTPELVGGEAVVGFFLDGEEAQQPVIMGCFHRSPVVENVENPQPFEPFTGQKGNLKPKGSSTRLKLGQKGTMIEPPVSIGSGSQFTMGSNPDFQISDDPDITLEPGFFPLSSNSDSTTGSTFAKFNGLSSDKLFYDEFGEGAFLGAYAEQKPVDGDNGCGDNILGQIESALQGFIGFVNGLEKTALGFIDPLRNKIVDIQQDVRSVARLISSIMKFVINGMRDNIFKLIGKLFKLLGITLPSPLSLPISEAAKQILNLIFCIFEKLFGPLMDFIMGLLNGLAGKSPNIPRCAVEEFVASLVDKLASMIDNALSTILGGLDWLASGISSIAGTLRGGLDIISQLLSFISCDALACKGTSSWDPFAGIEFPETDSWANTINNIDILGGYGNSIDEAVGYLSMFGSQDTPFKDCRRRIVNPQNQDEMQRLPLFTRFYTCLPPKVTVVGDGTGALVKPIVSEINGSILSFVICDPGRGYTYPPEIRVMDKTNYGSGAIARSVINSDGSLNSIYILSGGSGYCPLNLEEETKPRTDPTTGETLPPCIPVDNKLSTTIVGINTNVVVVSPGRNYSPDDNIFVGNCVYKPILTPNGQIIGIEPPQNCPQLFNDTPIVEINTTTGEGAELYPVIRYAPQFIADFGEGVGIGTTFIKNVVQCV